GEAADSPWIRRHDAGKIDSKRWVFVHVPKTAGTTIWDALGPSYTDSGRYDEVQFGCMKHNPPRDHVRNSFAIVREPCDRLVSEFAWAKNQAWFDVYYKEYRVAKAFPPTCEMFNGWVRAVLRRYAERSDVEDCHVIPQWCYLAKVERILPLDGHLQDHFRSLAPDFRDVVLKRLNSDDSARRSNVTCACLDAENLLAIQQHFRDDFATWRLVSGNSSPFAPRGADPRARRASCSFRKNGMEI
ncbi:MCAT, partial [Symbiodinium natans]